MGEFYPSILAQPHRADRPPLSSLIIYGSADGRVDDGGGGGQLRMKLRQSGGILVRGTQYT